MPTGGPGEAFSHSDERAGIRRAAPGGVERFTATLQPFSRVVLSGELDVFALDALRAALDQAFADADELISVEARDLDTIDGAAISELLRYQIWAARQHRRLLLGPVSRAVSHVLDLLDMRHLLMGWPCPSSSDARVP